VVCEGAWHGSCYQQLASDPFPVLQASDLDESFLGAEVLEDDDPNRFKWAREGDHLMCPFQCDTCHFYNIQKRRPGAKAQDNVLLMCIRRAILDSFWSRESATVESNRREGARMRSGGERLGLDMPYPERHAFPMEDSFGMAIACQTLLRSLDGGRNAATIQFETMRKLRSHYSNFHHTLPDGTGLSTIVEGRGSSTFTGSPTYSYWFRRFMTGCHRRMGDTWIPDRAITLEEILHSYTLLEEDWKKFSGDPDMRLQTALTAMILVGGFSGGLRGEELPKLELGAIRKHWDEAIHHNTPHVPLVLAGRFKMSDGEKLFFLPLACESKSGIHIRLWTHRLLEAYGALRVYHGPVFRMGGRREKVKRSAMGDLDPLLHGILIRVQERWPRVLPPSVKISDEFSVRRSLRRGSTTEASNRGIPKEVIEANQRWGKHQRSRGVLPGMSMMERYSDARANIGYLIRYSLGL
jgi:hypothetical protein